MHRTSSSAECAHGKNADTRLSLISIRGCSEMHDTTLMAQGKQEMSMADSVRLTKVVIYELDLWQSESVVEGHEYGWLNHNVNHVHGCMPKEEG